jgi:hypothetical protein
MSTVVAAVFKDHTSAEQVRTHLVKDGFPTDRVELTSCRELGQAKVVPTPDIADKLARYFEQLFPAPAGRPSVRRLQGAVLSGEAVIAVHPRGEIEIKRAVEILTEGDPADIRARDLHDQTLEHAAASDESSALSWIGRVMVAPQARDR